MWMKLWHLAQQHQATITVDADPEIVVLTQPDGSKIGTYWDGTDWIAGESQRVVRVVLTDPDRYFADCRLELAAVAACVRR
jgi:hypothetical protein